MVSEHEIGARIREFRKMRGLTLQDLSEKTNYTKGYLSKLEKSSKAPPVSTLIVLAKALDVTVSEILGETHSKASICLVKRNERREMARSGSVFGYSYQTVAHGFPNKRMEPYILTLPLRPKRKAIFQHPGEEILFVLEGTMKFFHGDQEFLVEEGDCIYFDANIPHYGICHGDKEVKCFMVIYSPQE